MTGLGCVKWVVGVDALLNNNLQPGWKIKGAERKQPAAGRCFASSACFSWTVLCATSAFEPESYGLKPLQTEVFLL